MCQSRLPSGALDRICLEARQGGPDPAGQVWDCGEPRRFGAQHGRKGPLLKITNENPELPSANAVLATRSTSRSMACSRPKGNHFRGWHGSRSRQSRRMTLQAERARASSPMRVVASSGLMRSTRISSIRPAPRLSAMVVGRRTSLITCTRRDSGPAPAVLAVSADPKGAPQTDAEPDQEHPQVPVTPAGNISSFNHVVGNWQKIKLSADRPPRLFSLSLG